MCRETQSCRRRMRSLETATVPRVTLSLESWPNGAPRRKKFCWMISGLQELVRRDSA